MDEIYGPTRIRPGLDEQRCSRANGTLATTTLANCQTFFSIEALRLLAVHDMAFTAQEHVQTPIAEPPLLGSQFAQAKDVDRRLRAAGLCTGSSCDPPG